MKTTTNTYLPCVILALSLSSISNSDALGAWTQHQGNAWHNGNVGEAIGAIGFKQAWSILATDLGGSIVPGVVSDGGTVYFSARTNGADPYSVIAVDSVTAAEDWRRGFKPYSGGISAPSIGNGKVYVHQWGHSGISGGNASQYPYVFGLDAANGDIDFATNHSGQWSSGSRPTVIDDQVFAAGGYYGGLDAYDGVNGGVDWFAKVNQQYGWIPAADEDHVYVYMGAASASPGPKTGRLYAFDRRTGASAFTIINSDDTWTRNNASPIVGSQGNVLAFSSARDGNKLVSFDISTESVVWRYPVLTNGYVAVDDGLVFAPNGIELTVLDEATGTPVDRWFAPSGEAITGNLIVADDALIVQTDQRTYLLDRSSFDELWSTELKGEVAYTDGMLFISNSSGVYALATVPEPSSAIMLASACMVLLRSCRCRRHTV
ncbi:Outer membrane protein assembly factor BamB [Botrimarina colliarenosi]|uniref:Outer membrane protein assembly factor BamB n=1 Tax=Botrimarina colliarenosi TaxID=2528001 RepID=A0A5C5ZWJ5_9BACT|nr:PQQ-binding-like beta-propeller repeat protein [Botrimarina colliarenosi]TWT91530.1 Outer membrane protein assembly factor BamB [Botrimarina colliarenosi]